MAGQNSRKEMSTIPWQFWAAQGREREGTFQVEHIGARYAWEEGDLDLPVCRRPLQSGERRWPMGRVPNSWRSGRCPSAPAQTLDLSSILDPADPVQSLLAWEDVQVRWPQTAAVRGLLGLTWWLPSPCWVVRLHQVTLLAKLDGVQLCGLWPGAPHPSEVAEWGEWLGFQEAALCPLQLPALSTERSQTHNHPLKITFAPSWLLEMTLFRIGLQLENCRWPSPTPTVSADSFLLYLS